MENYNITDYVRFGLLDYVKNEVENGANVNTHEIVETEESKYRTWYTRASYTRGRSLLMEAAIGRYPDVVEYLISKGADVNYDGGNGLGTVLEDAKRHSTPEIVDILIKAGAKDEGKDIKVNPYNKPNDKFGRGTEIVKKYAIERAEARRLEKSAKAHENYLATYSGVVMKIVNKICSLCGAKDYKDIVENIDIYRDKFSKNDLKVLRSMDDFMDGQPDIDLYDMSGVRPLRNIANRIGNTVGRWGGYPYTEDENGWGVHKSEFTEWLVSEVGFILPEGIKDFSEAWYDWEYNLSKSIPGCDYQDHEKWTKRLAEMKAYEEKFPFVLTALEGLSDEEIGLELREGYGYLYYTIA